MKYHLLYSNFNPETGESVVQLGTNLGVFTGTSHLQKADEQYPSNFFGCQCADLKARRKYCKARARQAALQLETLVTYRERMRATRSFSPDAYYLTVLESEIKHYEAEVKKWKEHAAAYDLRLRESIVARDVTLKHLYAPRGRVNE